MTLATLTTRGDALEVLTTCPVIADHHWRQRRDLVRLAGAQRLQLLIHLPGCAPLSLAWEPPALPEALSLPSVSTTRRRPRRFCP